MLEFNDLVCRQLGYTREEFSNLTINDIDILESKEETEQRIKSILKHKGAEFETKHRTKQGEIRDIQVTARIIKSGDKDIYHCIWHDITDKKKNEQELIRAKEKAEESETKYRNWFQHFPHATFIWKKIDDDFEMVMANKKAYDDSDGKIAQIFGIKSRILWKDEPDLTQYLVDCYQTKETKNIKRKYYFRGSGKEQYTSTTYSFIPPDSIQIITMDITKEIQAEHELIKAKEKSEENEAKLISITNAAQDAIIMIDNTGKISFWNPAAAKIFGYTEEEALGKDLHEFIAPENYHHSFKTAFSKFKTSGEGKYVGKTIELSGRKKDGTEILVSLSLSGMNLNNERSAVGVLRDISEQKKAEARLRESEAKFRSTFDQSPIGAIIVGIDKRFVKCNQAFCNFIGYTEAELIGKTISEITYEEDLNIGMKELGQIIKGEISTHATEKRYRKKNGSIVWGEITISLVRDKENKPLYFLPIVKDITEKKESEKSIQKMEAMQHKMVANIGDVIVIIDENGRNAYKSPNIENLFGWKPEELVGRSTWDNVHEEDLAFAQEFINSLLAKPNLSGSAEVRYKCKDGSYKFIEFTGVNLFHDPDINGILGNYHDITERKLAEQNLLLAKQKAEESDRLKTAFLQNMSHEIRTPLNAISGFSEILGKSGISDEKRGSFVSIIQNSSSQLLSIVNNVLTISSLETKQEKLKIEKVCINNVIVELLAIFTQQSKNQNIKLFSKQGLPDNRSEIYTDKTKITQVLSNLISNALKFTHEGTIEFGYIHRNDLTLKKVEDTPLGELEFYIKDTGIGIKPEVHEKIFERFRQADPATSTNYGGTGLGLSISKGFIEMLGGRIWVKSEVEKGSIFYFTLPYNPANIEQISGIKTKNTLEMKTILVAEDEEYNYLYIEEILNDLDIKILHTKNGLETVELCKKNPDIQLVLMDIKMPGLDGHSAAKQIKEIRPDLPIIAQSAYALEQELEKYRATFNAYLTKPISATDLINTVKAYL